MKFPALLAAVLALATASAPAAAAQYDLELIVFTQPQQLAGNESPPALSPQPPPLPLDLPITLLPADDYRLHGPAQAIRQDARYRLLLHAAWRQEGLEKNRAFAVPVHRLAGADAAPQLQGTVQLILSRYLHLEAHLQFDPEATIDGDAFDLGLLNRRVYQMDETRRMRSRELHYLDHPKFGLLILIMPHEVFEPDPPPDFVPAEQAPSEPETTPAPRPDGMSGVIQRY
jgi:hypothetical protein